MAEKTRKKQKPQMQAEPKPPFPEQHQEKPGIESELEPRPEYQAPLYRAAGKLQGKAALSFVGARSVSDGTGPTRR
jgi:hypothetical protein